MADVLIYKSDDLSNVRLQKYFKIFKNENISVQLIGWKRSENLEQFEGDNRVKYLQTGGGYGNKKKLLFGYIFFLLKLFFYLLSKGKTHKNIVINFDTALVFFITSFFTKSKYIYEVHDSFSLSYNFPLFLKKFIEYLDKKIMDNATYVIHVDENRIVDINHKNVLIYNSPLDFFDNGFTKREFSQTFAVVGNISRARGAFSIYGFAKDNPDVKFLVVGKFYDSDLKDKFLELSNITCKDYLPQDQLFDLMLDCCGIFSLYDPNLEINKLAASNKVYDAMMLGMPVITNPEVINSKFILKNQIGIVVNYHYDKSWDKLKESQYMNEAMVMGANGRQLYEEYFKFENLVRERLIRKIA